MKIPEIWKCKTKKLSQFKSIEFQAGRWKNWSYVEISLRWSRAEDHAGIRFAVELFGFYLYIVLYDVRHWDYDNNEWEK